MSADQVEEYVPTDAFVGQAYLFVGNGDSPEQYTQYCEIDTISGVGQKNDQVDATTFCSGGVKQYIAGLSDGNEVSFGANYSLSNAVQEGLIDDVEAKKIRAFQLVVGNDSPQKIFQFNLTMLSWELDPSVSAKNTIKFSGKITGPIARLQ
jgi:hypothetical protein